MFSNDYIRNICLILFLVFMPLEAWPNEEIVLTKPIEIRMEKEMVLSTEKIVLGDVATIYAKSMRDFQALSSLVIGQVPGDTKELKVPLSYIRARIKEILPSETQFSLRAPLEVVFRQEKMGLSVEDLAHEIIRQGKEKGKIPNFVDAQLEPMNGFDKLDFYKISNLKIEPSGEMPNWKGEMNFKISSANLHNTAQSWIKIRLRWFTEAWVAKSDIRAYQNLSAAQFKKIRTEITNIREDLINAADEDALNIALKSARTKRTIMAQNPITTNMLDRKPDMAPGQKLKVVFVSENGLQVSADGAIIGTGSIGDDVRAKLRSSKKIVTGKLVSDGVLEVSL